MLQYQTIGFVYTRTCPLSCRHCIIESSPKAQGKMSKRAAEQYLTTIARFSKQVCFSGGEALLYYHEVVDLIRTAKSLGLLTSVVSGAGWVRTDKAHIARERVLGLKNAGLDSVCLSWDQYHEEFSPRENAELLAALVVEHGIALTIRGVAPATQPKPYPTYMFDQPAEFRNLVQLGSARQLPAAHFFAFEEPPYGTCDTVLSPVIEPDGNVYACCGPSRFSHESSPLVLGNTNEETLDAILDRGMRDPLLRALNLVGPRGLYELLKATPEYAQFFRKRDHYGSICNVCMDMTDVPEIVAALRARMSDMEGKAMLAAAEIRHKLGRVQNLPAPAPRKLQEAHHVG
ncbi:radical SAM/SPASM domain-containing protein [Acidipila sp. EB88]|uniref:radical SAM/SPASM domain-containing protein n=1 Tax=Acidipila sp. EB88 TaxID=2305226 RepID=UPI000F5FD631|nr:radical SAM/SPASM domain-containing protein [Acidipila sp. EB88]RRA47446.1 radical SAM protein [Acidipila sp. EB88]